MPQKRPTSTLNMGERVAIAYNTILGRPVRTHWDSGVGSAPSYTDAIYKAVIPNFLYKPPFGFPLGKDIPEIRRLSATPYVSMVRNTVVNQISGLDWDIKARDGHDVPDAIIEKTKDFFYNPNRNDESLNSIIKKYAGAILEIDAGVIVKVRNLKDELQEIYVRDGGTFTKSPDIYGIMPDENAYYQYGWLTGARPIPFNKNEVLYQMMNPRDDGIYGRSAAENLLDVLQLLAYGIDSNLDYFKSNVAKGVFQMVGAHTDDITAFSKQWQEQLREKDEAGNWRKKFHTMPIINTEGNFVRVGFNNAELELLQQQEWFSKVVWACYGITPSELGFTENSNKATEIGQSAVVKRKLVRPYTELLEFGFNTGIINDLPWIKGKWEDKLIFDFDKFDLQEELAKRQLYWGDIDKGVMTPNEVREELDKEPIEGGDELKFGKMGPLGLQTTASINKQTFNPMKPGNQNKDALAQQTRDETGLKAQTTEMINEGLKKKREQYMILTKAMAKDNTNVPMATDKFFNERLTQVINESEKDIIYAIRREVGIRTMSEIKAINKEFITALTEKIGLGGLVLTLKGIIKSNFYKGVEDVAQKTERNFVPNQEALNFIQDYTFDNITGLEEELKNKLRGELERGIMNNEDVDALAERVKGVMGVGEVRAKAIARTESNRAENMGELDAWKQTGLPVTKTWKAVIDSKTSAICKALDGKTVGINEKFTVRGQEFESPPSHVNCRSLLEYSIGDDR